MRNMCNCSRPHCHAGPMLDAGFFGSGDCPEPPTCHVGFAAASHMFRVSDFSGAYAGGIQRGGSGGFARTQFAPHNIIARGFGLENDIVFGEERRRNQGRDTGGFWFGGRPGYW